MPTKKPLYTATFTHEGKRYYVRSATSQRDAEKRAAKRLMELESGTQKLDGNVLVEDYALLWVETYVKPAVDDPTYRDTLSRLKNHILPAIGTMQMQDVRATHLQSILNAAAHYSKSFCTKIHTALIGVFAQAVRDRIIQESPAGALKLPKAADGSHRSITEEERQALLAAAATHRLGLFVKIMLWCGLRPQEVAVLRVHSIDRANQRVQVRQALKKDGSIGPPKSAAGVRDVPIPPQLWAELEPRISHAQGDDFLCRNAKGQHHTHTSIRRGWASLTRQMDLLLGAQTVPVNGQLKIVRSKIAPDLTLYCLRHTYCTDLEAAGIPINVAKYLMGHSSIAMTARIYTHIREDTLDMATQQIAAFAAKMGATAGATQKPEITSNSTETSWPPLMEENYKFKQ